MPFSASASTIGELVRFAHRRFTKCWSEHGLTRKMSADHVKKLERIKLMVDAGIYISRSRE